MTDAAFDAQRARLRGPDMFARFVVADEGTPVAERNWRPDEDILVVERGGRRLALLARQMTYHHVAQGKLAGEPYLVSF